MKTMYASTWVGLILSLLASVSHAADSASATDCAFNPPQAILQAKGYAHYAFTRKAQNQAIETAEVRPGLRIEISQSQCVDFIDTEITFIVPNGRLAEQNENDWLTFAQTEIGRLKRTGSARDLRDLRQFLVQARDIAPRNGARSTCKDDSIAEAGQCSWESMGGYIFRVTKGRSNVRISATEYVSG